MNAKAALFELLQSIAFERKRVILASGKESDFYIDCRKVSLHPEGLVLCGKALFEHAMNCFPGTFSAVGGPTLGADPLIASFSYTSHAHGQPIPSFIVRKEAKGYGAGQWIEGTHNIPAGSKLLLLEDVVTTGGSTVRAIEACRTEGFEPVQVLALVDRQEGGRRAIESAGVSFDSLFTKSDFPGEDA